jgi:hypothetical protein
MQSPVWIWENPTQGKTELAPLLGNGNKHSVKPAFNAKLDCGFVARVQRKIFLKLKQRVSEPVRRR